MQSAASISAPLSIGQASRELGVAADTLLYYERIGLVPRTARSGGGQRRYAPGDLARLRFIRRAQAMDFTLAEIGALLELRAASGDVRADVRALARMKLADIDARLSELEALRAELGALIDRCAASNSGPCPILTRLGGEIRTEDQDHA